MCRIRARKNNTQGHNSQLNEYIESLIIERIGILEQNAASKFPTIIKIDDRKFSFK